MKESALAMRDELLNWLMGALMGMREIWENGIYGVDLSRILVAILIFAFFLLFRRFFTRIVLKKLDDLTSRTRTPLDNAVLRALSRPLGFIPVVLGIFFAVDYLPLSGALDRVADRVVRSLIVFTIFWCLVLMVTPLSTLLNRLRQILTLSMIDWLVKAVRVVLVLTAMATIFEVWGIRIGPIIAGLGLFGVAVALGAQDLFKNLISGTLIVAEKRFNPGDWIRVDGVAEGTVETIGFRSTRIRRFDNAPVYVPNSRLSDNSLVNFSKMIHRRIYWVIRLEYRTDLSRLRRIREEIEAAIRASGEFVTPPEASLFVRIDQFSESSIDLMIYCFTHTTNWGEWLIIKENLAFQIKDIVESAGAAFALPARSVFVEAGAPETGGAHAAVLVGEKDDPEEFLPPQGPADTADMDGDGIADAGDQG